MTPKRNLFLQASLILLMVFSNSGFAIGSAGHDHSRASSSESHSISSPQQTALDHGNHHIMHGSKMAGAESHSNHSEVEEPRHSHEGEDCVCDDLCCLSTVSLFDSSIDSKITLADNQLVKPAQFYQSISLDLLLPPPTR